MTTFAFICGVVVGAFAALCIALVALAIRAHRHIAAENARKWDDRGQPTYDRHGNLTGWLK